MRSDLAMLNETVKKHEYDDSAETTGYQKPNLHRGETMRPHPVYREYFRECSPQCSQLRFPYFHIACYISTRGKPLRCYDA